MFEALAIYLGGVAGLSAKAGFQGNGTNEDIGMILLWPLILIALLGYLFGCGLSAFVHGWRNG